MAIVQFNAVAPGLNNANPRTVQIVSTDNYAAVTAAGYLNGENKAGNTILATDMIEMIYGYANGAGTLAIFGVSIANGVITLVNTAISDIVTLPVVSGDFVVFNGTTGLMKDAGYSASNAAKTKVVMANGATIVSHIATFADVAGTVQDGGLGLIAGTTAVYAGGGTSNAFTATGLTAASIVTASILTSATAVSVAKVVPGTNLLTITFSADPGAGTTLNYIAFTA